MTPETWQRLDAIFQRAIQLPTGERPAFLDDACDGDSELRATVERLLQADDEAEAEVGVKELIPRTIASVVDLLPPTAAERFVGPYRLAEQIGEGGMGAVYQGVRSDDEFEQRVAVKLIRPGLDSGFFVQRFRRERQILAGLEHPNIARLLDGGTTPEGLPYFVMEYIEGEPIDRYCDVHRLSVPQRLELFLTVCAAVGHAHQNLVVHRDLKPSNILVTQDGTVKLLDFGVAKLLDPEGEAGAADLEPTATLGHALTLQYASPEQLRRGLVTTSSDVYSLGVLLYQLLGGRRPYELDGLTLREAEGLILEREPPLPSTVIDAGVARCRRSREESLRRQLRGDLDRITAVALRKERERRYGSVEQLAADLRRHLAGHPVLARRSTLRYRAGKFLRRNRLPLAVAAAFALTVVVAGAGLARQSQRIRQERDLARLEGEKALRASQFMVDLFEVTNPEKSWAEKLTAREMLDQGSERVRRELQGQPVAQALLFDTIGRLYRKLGLFTEARPFLQEALEQRRKSLGGEHSEVARSLRHLGQLARDEGDYDRAEALLRESLEIYRSLHGPEHRDVAVGLNDLALALGDQGRYEEAERLLREALERYQRLEMDADFPAAVAASNLGQLLETRGEYEEAEVFLHRSLDLHRSLLGESHPIIAKDLNKLGFLAETLGDLEAAGDLYRQALEMRRQVLSPRHPDLYESLNNLGSVHLARGDLEDAEQLFQEALDKARDSRGPRHPEVTPLLNNLAMVQQNQGRFDEAEALFVEALDIRIEAHGEDHPAVATSRENLAVLKFNTGRYDDAEPLYRRVLEQRQRQLDAHHPSVAASLANLALVHQVRGEHGEAERLQRRALDIRLRAFGEEHTAVASSLHALGRALAGQGELLEAEELLRRAVTLQGELWPEGHRRLASPLLALGDVLTRRGTLEEAEGLLRQAVDIRRAALPSGHWQIAEAESYLGAWLAARGKRDRAESLLRSAHAVLEQQRGVDDFKTLEARRRLERFLNEAL